MPFCSIERKSRAFKRRSRDRKETSQSKVCTTQCFFARCYQTKQREKCSPCLVAIRKYFEGCHCYQVRYRQYRARQPHKYPGRPFFLIVEHVVVDEAALAIAEFKPDRGSASQTSKYVWYTVAGVPPSSTSLQAARPQVERSKFISSPNSNDVREDCGIKLIRDRCGMTRGRKQDNLRI